MTFAGRGTSARGWQQINRVVRDAIGTREAQLATAGVILVFEAADRLPLVYVDHARLEDVIVNLIQNAEAAIAARRDRKSAAGPVPPRARGEIRISTTMQSEPDRILVEVADNGSGLKQADLTRVFDPFFTTSEVGQGIGLGLSVCYGVIREHGGQITARNRDAGGAAFTIELPVMAESLIAATQLSATAVSEEMRSSTAPATSFVTVAPRGEDPDVTTRRRRALVVDDEESNAALVRRVLAGAGYDVESTTLSRRALVMIERSEYEVVICDVRMPELSGQELYGRVCQIRPEMARRFIFITGDIDGDDTREFLDESRCSYFMKPFNLERLTGAVDMLTGARSADTIG
jgi:two-component system NtrC family sensor kinase